MIDIPVRRMIIMAQAAAASAFDTDERDQPRWSPRTRTMIIVTMATISWALPAGLVYGLSRIFL
jgi:hypothetical protein